MRKQQCVFIFAGLGAVVLQRTKRSCGAAFHGIIVCTQNAVNHILHTVVTYNSSKQTLTELIKFQLFQTVGTLIDYCAAIGFCFTIAKFQPQQRFETKHAILAIGLIIAIGHKLP